MPKYYCDYCDTYLTHDSPSVRKTHCQGRKHKDNVKFYYQKWMEEQAQNLIDATTAAYKAGKIGIKGVCIPPPNMGPAAPQMALPPGAMMPPGQMPMGAPPMMPMPPMMRPPMNQMPMGAPPMMPPMPSTMRPPPPIMVNTPPGKQAQ
ncbi:U1 small nuclear ribonucleoprotein C [Daktulosphaira vitifoliae]|uniref:U1 small nuclear ribonucleoprotein C n=1 Tax=Daktulosphaira vitifoliae TaxID=58002 RepID=UPI0021AA54A5|nr:U1 small nuclear ribonucleoprotein C [Daktulosphaira vitifoliae]